MMVGQIPYPLPPPGPARITHQRLIQGVLSGEDADRLLRQGVPWTVVAPHVQDLAWWGRQEPVLAAPPSLPWRVRAWDATLQIEIENEAHWIDPGPAAPDPPVQTPDLIIVTHAHHDHIAKLGEYSASHPETPVVMSSQTAELLRVREQYDPLLRECLAGRTVLLEFGQPCEIGGVTVELTPAGHLLGAAMVEIRRGEDTILVTGDFALRDVGGLPGADWPRQGYAAVIMEATMANHRQLPLASPEATRKPFLQEVAQFLELGGDRLLVPAQSMGQAQELYAALALAQQEGAFEQIRVRVAGLAARVSEYYARYLKDRSGGPWACRFHTLQIDEIPPHSVVIASGDAEDDGSGMAGRLAEAMPLAPDKAILAAPPAYTHAGWGERMTFAMGVPAHAILLYNGHSHSSQETLIGAGRKARTLPARSMEWTNLNS